MQNKRFRLRNNFILNILFSFSSVVLALFGFLAVLPPATEPEASAIIDGEQFALTVTNSDSLSLNINPTDSGAIAIAKDTIVANTNSPAGYKLYVSTDSETSNDIHLNGRESNDTEDKKIIAASGTFETPLALNQNESSWGFALAGVNGFDSSYDIANPSPSAKFAAVPEKNNEQLIHDHEGRATDDETEIYFAAKANTDIASGNYQTTILYTTLSEATDQDQTEINLDKTVFANDYEVGDKTVNATTSIMVSKTPNLTVKINNIEATNVIVTSIAPLSFMFDLPANLDDGEYDFMITLENLAKSYTKPKAIKIKPAMAYMQDMTPEVCDSLVLEEQIQLVDKRDNKTYWVAKLKDGNCWMTQNLDYDLSITENQTLTPATSNVTENRTVVPANTNLATFKTDPNAIYYLNGGDTYYANGTTKTEGLSALPEDDINRHYAQGDYYSWKAATAGVGTTSITNTDVNESICPAGWRLPTSNSADANYSFGNLVKQYGYTGTEQSGTTDATLLASPLFFARSGYIYSSSLTSQGSYGRYWSSRAIHVSGAYYLRFGSNVVSPSSGDNRCIGSGVRCVAQGKDLNSISTMQEMTPEIVAKTPVDTSKQLTDTRDGKKYWVTKLADDNIWMTQNLDYDLSTETTLTPEDSDVTANWTPSRATITGVANISSYANDNNTPYSFDPGNYYFDGTYYASAECNYLTTTCNHFATTPYDRNGEHGHVGNYYNWSAAVASNDTSTTTAAGTDMNTSICPKGWRLPHGNDSASGNDFATLITAYGGATNSDSVLLANPLFFVRGGTVVSGSSGYSASNGYYWSSTASSATHADDFFFDSGRILTSNIYRQRGFSVRCVARGKDLSMISTMQEMTPEVVSNTNENESKQLTDTRDGKTYWVTKLKDGNIWMTQNLDLDLSATTTLTPADSDVTANWTPSSTTIVGAANLNLTNWVDNYNNPYSFDPGNYYSDGTYYDSAACNYLTTTCDHFATTPYDLNGEHGHVGNYYNWSAAVASNDTSATTAAGTDMSSSICPKGWRLPHGYQSTQGNDFETLNTAYGGATKSDSALLANPLFFIRGGRVYSGSLYDSADFGYYWSSTANSATYADDFYFSSGRVSTSGYNYRFTGFNVRCLAR